jgi:hypothetical protein
MKPNTQNPLSVTLEGVRDIDRANRVSDIYGSPPFRTEIQQHYSAALDPELKPFRGPHEEYEWKPTQFGPIQRKTDHAKAMEKVRDNVDVNLSPEVSELLLEALHKQARLRGAARIKDALLHPLATYGAYALKRSFNKSLSQER